MNSLKRPNVFFFNQSKHLRIFIIVVFHAIGSVLGQSTRTAKAAPNAIGSAGNAATVSNITYSWSVGETVIFTGAISDGFLTQGFQQPMVCKTMPVIVASNQTSCSLPYTLSVSTGFNRYQWMYGTSIIASGRNSDYNPIKDGTYSVLVGDSTGCYLTATAVKVDLSAKNIIPNIAVYGLNVATDTMMVSTPAATYQWYVILPDGSHKAIVGATYQNYRPLFAGTYYVKINTKDNCIAYSAPYSVNNSLLDPLNKYSFDQTDSTIDIKLMKKIFERKLAVYPIPCKDNFNVDYESPSKNLVTLSLYNVLGVVVSSKSLKNDSGKLKYKFERDDLPSGRYLLNVSDGEEKMVYSLVLE